MSHLVATLVVVEDAVSIEEGDKEGSRAAFVPICQGVVLDDEVEQVGRFVLYGRVDLLTTEALVDGTDGAIELALGVMAEEFVLRECGADAPDDGPSFLDGEFPPRCGASGMAMRPSS